MPFTMETQEKTHWCWAAVAVSVKKFFAAASTLTQCDVVFPVLSNDGVIPGVRNCCTNKDLCNFPAVLQDALQLGITNNLRRTATNPLPFAGRTSVKSELRAGRVVAARIAWPSGGGHFVVIDGFTQYTSGAQIVNVADPFYEAGLMFYDELVSSYLGDGAWTDSFLLKP